MQTGRRYSSTAGETIPPYRLTREETQYATLWDKDNCLGISTATPENNQELMASSPDIQLLPQTQYKAQLWAGP